MHFIKIYCLLYPALPKHLPMRTLYLIAALAQIPNTSAAKITFCQMQQLCSFTSMSSAQSLQLLWPVSLFPSQSFSLRKWWTICLLCLFRSQLFKSALTLLLPFGKKLNTPFLILSTKTVGLVWCFFFLATSDNLTQLLIVWNFLFSISGAHTGCFRLQGTFYCIAQKKQNKGCNFISFVTCWYLMDK